MPSARAIAHRIRSGVKRRVVGVLQRVGLRDIPQHDPMYHPSPDLHSAHRAAHETAAAPEPEKPAQAAVPEPASVEPAPAAALSPPSESSPEGDTAGAPLLTREAVETLFEEMVRPALQSDGGDITLVKVESGDVYVELMGACQTCPSSIVTMQMGIERLLREEFPQFGRLIRVNETP